MQNKFDFKDITIVPEPISYINSRSEINPYTDSGHLPIMVAPMDTVVCADNHRIFLDCGFIVCSPRGGGYFSTNTFLSMSLDEFERFLAQYPLAYSGDEIVRILVDVANGHMNRLVEAATRFCEIRKSPNHQLMVGNIANSKTYEIFAKIGVDYVRVGIGGGSGCLTSANIGVHYPMASLIYDVYKIKKSGNYTTKIVADGGFRNYDDIIKALALGADYVMLGGILNRCLESCGTTKLFGVITISNQMADFIWFKVPRLRKYMSKSFRGMSTKAVQIKWGKEVIKTSEGITKKNPVEYTAKQWRDNFVDYLRSAMSYTNSLDLESFKSSEFVHITENALKRFNK